MRKQTHLEKEGNEMIPKVNLLYFKISVQSSSERCQTATSGSIFRDPQLNIRSNAGNPAEEEE